MIGLIRAHVLVRRDGVHLSFEAFRTVFVTFVALWSAIFAWQCSLAFDKGTFGFCGAVIEGLRNAAYILYGSRLARELAKRYPLRHVVRAPGSRLLTAVRFVFPARYVERVFEPIVADHCEEWVEAEARGAVWHSRWIRARCVICMVQAMGLQSAVASAKSFIDLWRL